jgi:hypothetical protein
MRTYRAWHAIAAISQPFGRVIVSSAWTTGTISSGFGIGRYPETLEESCNMKVWIQREFVVDASL